MSPNWLTDEAVELEIAKLQQSEYVKLARKEMRLKYKRRQALYQLRNLEKRGKELARAGITIENIEMLIAIAEDEESRTEETERG